jgi:bifunctional ADP-heptose synthase (sugar kinase/adenylyltransferase)
MAENANLISILDSCRRPTLLVVGDIMLDRFVWGKMDVFPRRLLWV